jgi:hypothetical protein
MENYFKQKKVIWDHILRENEENSSEAKDDIKMHALLKGEKKVLNLQERDIRMKMMQQKCQETQTSSSAPSAGSVG